MHACRLDEVGHNMADALGNLHTLDFCDGVTLVQQYICTF